MRDINKEAEELADEAVFKDNTHLYASYFQGVIAGYNSKATQVKVLQGQIDLIQKIGNKGKEECYGNLKMELLSIYQQLKQLENE
jgi:hypothetical protein